MKGEKSINKFNNEPLFKNNNFNNSVVELFGIIQFDNYKIENDELISLKHNKEYDKNNLNYLNLNETMYTNRAYTF